ncbi:sugar phosphate isomerase/epimerase family protein [Lederbergia citrea]|uniref:sugar phosphate isomerase/epimerase family protein n=1 Tax=Lederbergia citrea TaxID=2833581 RepID=UPI001BCA1810|nr:sugar phosphate isomerase/epimerase family protein [Lederbergia citrea]MBS4177345.1 sugar phosphate isomerase/epimerase [Lederbergia citrea]
MKIGLLGLPTEETFKKAKEKGLEFVEFSINVDSNVDQFLNDVHEIVDWSKKHEVGVQSIGRWGSDRLDSKGNIIEEELKISYQLIDAASVLNCENFVAGCNYIKEISYYENCTGAIEYFSKLIDYGKEKGVKISTYNCDWNNFIDNEMAWTIIHGYLQELGIKYDPSHSRYGGRDYLKEMRDWGERFYHVHIKGSVIIEGARFDDPPAGLDQTDWKSFMAVLYAKGYDGGLSIEPHSHNWEGELGEKGVDYTVDFMKRLLV